MNWDGYESKPNQQSVKIMSSEHNPPPDPSKFVSLGSRPNARLSSIAFKSIGVDGACPSMGWKLFWGMKISCPDVAPKNRHSGKDSNGKDIIVIYFISAFVLRMSW
jgi:hypothetical protein